MLYTRLIIALCLFSCCKPAQKYPKFVRNPFTHQWAIVTGYGLACSILTPYSNLSNQDQYFGIREVVIVDHVFEDTVANVALGAEMTFPDSITAANVYLKWINSLSNKDSVMRRQQRIADSSWKHNHSYN